jgi:RimJ/RimL family protein N-acetyltransferase
MQATNGYVPTGLVRKTARLVLRDILQDDIPLLMEYAREMASHANVLRRQRDPDFNERFFRDAAGYNARVSPADREALLLAVCPLGQDTPIGYCSMHYLSQDSMVMGWHYGTAFSGQGYATEAATELVEFAFGCLAMKRVVADCLATNKSSIAIFRKLGMQQAPGMWRDWLRGARHFELQRVVRYGIDVDSRMSSRG